jgi:hypothetical protein
LETALESATNLISANRLDVFTKTPLVYAWAHDLDDAWGQELYGAYMLATRPPEGFSENNSKFSLTDYVISFRAIFESIKTNGFDAKNGTIPAGEKGITNGAHRLAVALVLGENVVQGISTDIAHNYGFKFFQSVGLSECFVDAAVVEYLNYATQTTVFCAMGITPSLAANIQKELNRASFETIYVKAIKLSEIGQRRLMKVLYGSNDWWTKELYESLTLERFNNQESSYFFFVESKTIENEIHFKSEIRNQYFDQFSFKKFHSTDSKAETIRVADSILNQNSLLVLNEAPIESEERLLREIRNHPYLSTLNPKTFAVDGSANLEILGIRKARDLDFIEIEKEFLEVAPHSSSHNSEYQTLPIKPTKLITDPRNYAIIEGYKFVSVPQTIAFKAHRGEGKDLLDISELCRRNVSGFVYGDENDRRKIIYLRLKLLMRKRVNRVIAPLPDGLQVLIRKSYVRLRDLI